MQTDGRFYELHDMVKAGSSNCTGCCACCHEMGDTIRLDPWDIKEMQIATGYGFEELMQKGYISLSIYDGMIAPCISMKPACSFLEKGRCSIHANRPGLCRLFPLGRNFEEGKINYILLKDTCNRNMVKVKVKDWIGVTDSKRYESFVLEWHYFAKDMAALIREMEEEQAKGCSLYLLQVFYQTPYDKEIDFYDQVITRIHIIREKINA